MPQQDALFMELLQILAGFHSMCTEYLQSWCASPSIFAIVQLSHSFMIKCYVHLKPTNYAGFVTWSNETMAQILAWVIILNGNGTSFIRSFQRTIYTLKCCLLPKWHTKTVLCVIARISALLSRRRGSFFWQLFEVYFLKCTRYKITWCFFTSFLVGINQMGVSQYEVLFATLIPTVFFHTFIIVIPGVFMQSS